MEPPKKPTDPPTANQPASSTSVQAEIRAYQGPIPSPQDLAAYQRVDPELVRQIVGMAQQQATHRQQLEKERLQADIELLKAQEYTMKRGQWLAFVLAAIIIITGGYVATHGAPWPGGLISATGIAGIITAFLKRPPKHT